MQGKLHHYQVSPVRGNDRRPGRPVRILVHGEMPMFYFRHVLDQNQSIAKHVHLIIFLVSYPMVNLNVNTNRNTINMPENRKKKKPKTNCDVAYDYADVMVTSL